MKQTRAMGWGGLTAALGLSLALLLPNVSLADRTAYPGEILIISDEIFGNSLDVTRPGGAGGAGDTGGCGSGGDSSGTDSSNTSSNSSGGTGGNNTSNNCSNNSSNDG